MCFDGDPVDLISRIDRRARKEHRCAECRRTIQPGETYLYETWVFDGDFDTHKTCAHCHAAREWLNRICSSWEHGAVLADLLEHWEEEPIYRTLGLGRLIICGGKGWCRNGDLVPVAHVEAWVADAVRRAPALAGAA